MAEAQHEIIVLLIQKKEFEKAAVEANKIFEMPFSPKIEAILYPSVQMEYISTNLAIKPEAFDEKFDFLKAEEFIVLNKTEGKRQFLSHKIAAATELDQKNLCWNTIYIDDDLQKFMRGYQVDIDNFK